MIDFYTSRMRIESNRRFAGLLNSHRERGNNAVFAVEFEVDEGMKIPERYLRNVKIAYTLHVDLMKLKRRGCSISDDRIYLETNVKGYNELYEIVRKILSL